MAGGGGGGGRRRSWDSLSPAYRKRLSGKGITRGQFESGVSLAAARGHGRTPERPTRADRKAEYAKYRANRAYAMRVITSDGVQVLSGMTAADRSIVGSHANSVGRFLSQGQAGSRLPSFAGTKVTGYTKESKYETAVTVTLETNFARLAVLQRSGELDFVDIYVKAA